jgi:chemotaxis protein MotB
MPTRRKREVEEEHVNHERWLITYADMITLLMVLFIVLFAISQVDQKRFEMLRDGMAAGFGETVSPFSGTEAVLTEQSVTPLAPVKPVRMDLGMGREGPDAEKVAQEVLRQDQLRSGRVRAEAVAEVKRLEALRRRIVEALRRNGLQRDVQTRIDHRGLRVSLVSRHVVFAPNIADLTPRGQRIVDVLAPVLRPVPDPLQIDGHTNQVQVKPKYYATDWDLSAARAITVLRRLAERGRVPEDRLTAAAYGHTRPLIDPALPSSQKINKRVDIVVLSGAGEDVRALFRSVLATGESR